MTNSKPTNAIADGRAIMRAHPSLSTNAAELLHTIDELTQDERLSVRRYLLHVYGITVGITTPHTRPLEETEHWAEDRNALAAASGHLLAVEDVLDETDPLGIASGLYAERILEVAHRG